MITSRRNSAMKSQNNGTHVWLVAPVTVAAIVLAGCGASDDAATPRGMGRPSPPRTKRPGSETTQPTSGATQADPAGSQSDPITAQPNPVVTRPGSRTAPPGLPAQSEEQWRQAMVKTPLPKPGCFRAVPQATSWEEIP